MSGQQKEKLWTCVKSHKVYQLGESELLYSLDTDKNLNCQTSVPDLLDIASISDAFLGQCSFIVPLAESFDKKLMIVWSSKGLRSGESYIGTITPRKILSKETSTYVIDDWKEEWIDNVICKFCRD